MEAKYIFKDKHVFKMSNIVIFFIKFYHFCSFQKCQCFKLAFQTSYVTNLSKILCTDMGWILYKSGVWYAEFKF